MLRRVLNKLEDPKTPLLGPNIKSLKFWGILMPKTAYMKCLTYMLHASIILFVATQYTDVWLVRTDLNFLLNNLKTSMMSTVNVLKLSMFIVWQRKWNDLIDYITKADLRQRMTKDSISKKIISQTTKYCRKITYTYWLLTYLTALSLVLQPISKYVFSATSRRNIKIGSEPYIEFVRSWVPFDKTKMSGYLIASIYQIHATYMVAGYISSFDTLVIVVMVFFKTEFTLLQRDSAHIYSVTKTDIGDAYARLTDCHRRHVQLIKYAELFNSCLSPVMFLYIVVCSIMLCASAYQITIETNSMHRLLTAEYLIFAIAQLFMYCWHSNEVVVASENLHFGPYQSAWYSQCVRQQKDIKMLSMQFQRSIVFRAGPFTDLTISTFISILKGAYSYYTLIK